MIGLKTKHADCRIIFKYAYCNLNYLVETTYARITDTSSLSVLLLLITLFITYAKTCTLKTLCKIKLAIFNFISDSICFVDIREVILAGLHVSNYGKTIRCVVLK